MQTLIFVSVHSLNLTEPCKSNTKIKILNKSERNSDSGKGNRIQTEDLLRRPPLKSRITSKPFKLWQPKLATFQSKIYLGTF